MFILFKLPNTQRQQRFRVYFLCVYCIYYVFMFKILATWRTICNCMGYKIVAHLHLHRTQGREQSCMLPQTLELWPAPGSHKSWLIFQGAFGQEPDSALNWSAYYIYIAINSTNGKMVVSPAFFCVAWRLVFTAYHWLFAGFHQGSSRLCLAHPPLVSKSNSFCLETGPTAKVRKDVYWVAR